MITPKAFLQRATRLAKDEFEWTGEDTLYALYRRWAFRHGRKGERAVPFGRFMTAVDKHVEPSVTLRPGMVLRPIVVEFEDQPVATTPRKREQSRYLGKLRLTEELAFVDGMMPAGALLDQYSALSHELEALQANAKTDAAATGKSPVSWVVVLWKGQRRRIPGRALVSCVEDATGAG